VIIGIRREDKNRWERRVPLVPADVADLQARGLRFRVQPSPDRIFADADYVEAGAEVAEDLGPCPLVLAVKEIPTRLLERNKAYVYFSHVIKGQDYNMPMLRRLLELECSLVDYERICGADGRRLIFFSIHAGYAGMIDTLWTLGQRLAARGVTTPLAEIKQTYEYSSFEDAKAHLRLIGERLAAEMPAELRPLVIGMAGYGNVARGCREVLDCLPCEWIDPADLAAAAVRDPEAPVLRCVEFREEHLVRPAQGQAYDLGEYYAHPERYEGAFAAHLDHLDVLMNTIYWEPRYPRLITRAWARENPSPRLQAIGDISCDIEGSIEITLEATMPDTPSFTYDPASDSITYGVDGPGPAIMAVDNLPCEVSRESSDHFSRVLRDLVPALAACDWSQPFADLDLPPELKNAVITHQGRLTPDYTYLEEHLDA
jgi:alpha-aminoadipic semialdehyde synthase